MSSLFTTDYNSGGTDNNDNDDYDNEERLDLKLSNYAIVSFEIGRLGEHTGSSYGQSLIVDVNDVEVLDGLLYDRKFVPSYEDPDDYEDETLKVFGHDKWFRTDEHGQLDEEVEEKLINRRTTETFGGTDYPYEFMERTTQEEDNIEVGDMTLWLGNGTKGRTFAKVVTPDGHDIIDDKDDDHNWLDTEDPSLRDDLEGRRIILFYKKDSFVPDDDDEEVEFTDAVILDEDTRAGITIQNGSSSGSSGSSGSSDGSSGDSTDGDSGSLGGGGDDGSKLAEGVPDELDDIIGFMARTDQTGKENVEQLVESELEEKTMDDVDLSAVLDEIESRR